MGDGHLAEYEVDLAPAVTLQMLLVTLRVEAADEGLAAIGGGVPATWQHGVVRREDHGVVRREGGRATGW